MTKRRSNLQKGMHQIKKSSKKFNYRHRYKTGQDWKKLKSRQCKKRESLSPFVVYEQSLYGTDLCGNCGSQSFCLQKTGWKKKKKKRRKWIPFFFVKVCVRVFFFFSFRNNNLIVKREKRLKWGSKERGCFGVFKVFQICGQ